MELIELPLTPPTIVEEAGGFVRFTVTTEDSIHITDLTPRQAKTLAYQLLILAEEAQSS